MGGATQTWVMTDHPWSLRCTPPRGLVRPVPVDPTGATGPTPGAARGPKWRTTSRGLFVPMGIPTPVEQRITEQAARLPPGSALTGWAACRLHGANFMDGLTPDGRTRLPVPLALGPSGNIRADGAVTLSRERLPTTEITYIVDIPVVTAERAVFDAMRSAPSERFAVAVLDTCIAAGLTTIATMAAYVEAHRGWNRLPLARFAITHARHGARSLQETAVRLIAEIDAGLPRLLLNVAVYDRHGRLLGLADLLDEQAGLVIEFDGADHRNRRQHTRDVGRDEDMRRVGLEVTRLTGTDLHHRTRVVARLLGARSRARFEPADQRSWVLGMGTSG